MAKAVEELRRSPTRRLRSEEWSEEQDLLLFQGKVYIPKDIKLICEIIKLHHETPVAGHPGQWKTLELVMCNYWWPGVTKFVFEYVDGLDRCQWYKNFPQPPAGKLMSPETPTEPWKNIAADFITRLPEAQGFDTILVVVDRSKKQMHVIPTTSEMSALGLAKLYRDNVWKLHGLPDSLISDRGPQFAAELMKELNRILGIQTKLSMAFHPQTDSQTEHVNQELEQYLQLFVSHRQDDWPEWLALGEFAYNNKIHSAIQVLPFYANYGFNL